MGCQISVRDGLGQPFSLGPDSLPSLMVNPSEIRHLRQHGESDRCPFCRTLGYWRRFNALATTQAERDLQAVFGRRFEEQKNRRSVGRVLW